MDSHVLLEFAACSSVASVRPETAGVSLHIPAPLPHSSKGPSVPSRWSVNLAGRPEHRPVKKISADHLNAGRDVLNTQLDRFSSSWRNSVPNGHRNHWVLLSSTVAPSNPLRTTAPLCEVLQGHIQPKWRFHLKMIAAAAAHHPT